MWDFAAAFSGWKKRHGIKPARSASVLNSDDVEDLLKWARDERARDDERDKREAQNG